MRSAAGHDVRAQQFCAMSYAFGDPVNGSRRDGG
jgi:hypothetical protein